LRTLDRHYDAAVTIEPQCLNDQLEIKVQRILTARPMSLMGHQRTSSDVRLTSASPR
jgi:hypothetical protein